MAVALCLPEGCFCHQSPTPTELHRPHGTLGRLGRSQVAPGNIPPSSLQPRVIQGPAAERLANPRGHREQESQGLPDPFLPTGNTGFPSTVASDPERKLILPGQETAPRSHPSRQCWCPRELCWDFASLSGLAIPAAVCLVGQPASSSCSFRGRSGRESGSRVRVSALPPPATLSPPHCRPHQTILSKTQPDFLQAY